MQLELHRGKHLFLKFINRSRTGMSFTVSILVRVPEAQPGFQMRNVSRDIAGFLKVGYNPVKDAAILRLHRVLDKDSLGPWIAAEIGRKMHSDASAFTWEWI